MFKSIKKLLFKQDIITDISANDDLVKKINEVKYIPKLNDIVKLPESKLLILNTYFYSFNELKQNILQKKVNRSFITGINFNEYFKDIDDFKRDIDRLLPIIENNEINFKIKDELTEIMDSIIFLNDLNKKP